MPVTDPLADMLAALSNASRASLDHAKIGSSRFRQAVLAVLQAEGFIRGFRVAGDRGPRRRIEIQMAYGPRRERLLNGARRMSKPGLRRYVGLGELKRFDRQIETTIVSTPQGIMTGKQAQARGTGGELLCLVW